MNRSNIFNRVTAFLFCLLFIFSFDVYAKNQWGTALRLYEQKQYIKALNQLEPLLPSHAPALLLQSLCLLELGFLEEANKGFEVYSKQVPEMTPFIRFNQALIHSNALPPSYNQLITIGLNPQTPNIFSFLALKKLAKAAKADPNRVSIPHEKIVSVLEADYDIPMLYENDLVSDEFSLYQKGLSAETEQNWVEAYRIWITFLKHYPNSKVLNMAKLKKGICLFNLGEFKKSEPILKRVSKKSEKSLIQQEAFYYLGRLYQYQGFLSQAVLYFEKIRHQPRTAWQLSLIFIRRKEFDRAEKLLLTVRQHPQANWLLGCIKFFKKEYEAAYSLFNENADSGLYHYWAIQSANAASRTSLAQLHTQKLTSLDRNSIYTDMLNTPSEQKPTKFQDIPLTRYDRLLQIHQEEWVAKDIRIRLHHNPESHPLAYRSLILKYAQKYAVSPLLVMAIIRQTSAFNPRHIHRYGKIGLLPLDLTDSKSTLTLDDLKNPKKNLEIGCSVIAQLIQHFQGNEYLAISAFLGDPNEVKTMQLALNFPPYAFLLNALEPSTSITVQKIISSYRIYQSKPWNQNS